MKKAIFNKLKIIFPLCALLALSNCIGLVGGYDIPEIIRIRSFYWNSINEFYICITISMQIFLLLVPMVNFYKKDFPTVVTYCITRNSNRKKWYYQKVSGLVTLSALTTIIYSCISLIILFLTGAISVSDWLQMLYLEFSIDILMFLYLAFSSILLNTISLLIKQSWVLPIGIVSTFVVAVDLYNIQQKENLKVILNPMANMFFPLHGDCYDLISDYDVLKLSDNFTLIYSIIYFVIITLAVVAVGQKIYTSMDLGLVKDE